MSGPTIALFGGSFDPPHLAHQMACLSALALIPADQVWLLPTARHAFGKALRPFDDRVAMCAAAAGPFGGAVEVSRIEEEIAAREADPRTYHTLLALRARRPDARFRLLIGEDILAERDRWHRWDDVAALAPPFVVGRLGHAGDPSVRVRLPPISSTEIRAALARGEDVSALVPRAVLDYIAGRGLYR
jgi:nicotinate-nucleotide adenylyltransferase